MRRDACSEFELNGSGWSLFFEKGTARTRRRRLGPTLQSAGGRAGEEGRAEWKQKKANTGVTAKRKRAAAVINSAQRCRSAVDSCP